MALKTDPKHKFKISGITGKRLPSKQALRADIKTLETKLELLRALLLEHLEPVEKQ